MHFYFGEGLELRCCCLCNIVTRDIAVLVGEQEKPVCSDCWENNPGVIDLGRA